MNAVLTTLAVIGLMAVVPLQAQSTGSPLSGPRKGLELRAVRNPPALYARQLLETRTPGTAPRIRFEWDRVAGSAAYVLAGHWTNDQSWALRSTEYRVTARNATSWQDDRIAFEVSLPEGSHSWKLVAIFGPNDDGDFENPAQLSFQLR